MRSPKKPAGSLRTCMSRCSWRFAAFRGAAGRKTFPVPRCFFRGSARIFFHPKNASAQGVEIESLKQMYLGHVLEPCFGWANVWFHVCKQGIGRSPSAVFFWMGSHSCEEYLKLWVSIGHKHSWFELLQDYSDHFQTSFFQTFSSVAVIHDHKEFEPMPIDSILSNRPAEIDLWGHAFALCSSLWCSLCQFVLKVRCWSECQEICQRKFGNPQQPGFQSFLIQYQLRSCKECQWLHTLTI